MTVIPHGVLHPSGDDRRCRPSSPASRGPSRCSSASCARTRASTCCSRPGAASTARSCGSSACRGWTRPRCRASAPPGVRFVERFVPDARGRGALPPRRPRRAAVPRDRPVRRAVHRARRRDAARPERVGGFPEVAADGAAELVPPGDAAALRDALARPARRSRAPASAWQPARDARRRERYGWDAIARAAPRPLCEARRVSEWRETNRAWWDERVPIHVASELLRRRGVPGRRLEAPRLRDRGGRDRRRPHAGAPPVPLRPRHALVGAPRARASAGSTSPARRSRRRAPWRDRAGLDAEFVQADVYDAVAALGGRRFDVVYTGRGALNWLPDIERWAQVMAALVAPGGRFYLCEMHPVRARIRRRRADRQAPVLPARGRSSGTTTAAPTPTPTRGRSTTGRSSGAIRSARSSRRSPAPGCGSSCCTSRTGRFATGWPFLERDPDERLYRLPDGLPSLPLMYSLLATAPA